MSTGRTFVAAAGLLLILLFVMWWLTNPPESHFLPPRYVPPPASENLQNSTSQVSRPSQTENGVTSDPRRVTTLAANSAGLVVWPGAAAASEALNKPDQSSREDIDAIHTMISDYHSVFGETPPGGLNEEITRGLLGDNPKKIVFLTARKGEVSPFGELLDRWGTPYFFHKLTRDVIDLRSAGPDHKLWTKDDIFEETATGTQL
jgi:hypothetical protein